MRKPLNSHIRRVAYHTVVYVNFVERGFKLLKRNGLLGFILPNKFFKTDYGKGLRGFLASNTAITKIVDFGAEQVLTPPLTLAFCSYARQKIRDFITPNPQPM